MRITEVNLRRLTGVMPVDGLFWEARVLQPADVYPDVARSWRSELAGQIDDTRYRVEGCFVEVGTDEGVTGLAGPVSETVAYHVAREVRPVVLGEDPRATERIWDLLHRTLVHGRQGTSMLAVSVVDCALWDLKGRWLGQPVYRLLGGTPDAFPAYASMLGFTVDDPGLVRERALWARRQGYAAQKWFFRFGPAHGHDGYRRNVALATTLRDVLGDDYEIMFDCWQGWDLPYAVRMSDALADLRPRWLEECLLADRVDSYGELRRRVRIPLAGGEHEYTRWGFRRFVDARALDVLQPDLYWAGGLSEVLKISALATAHDLMVVPHGTSTPTGVHFTAAQSPAHTPYQEYLVKWDEITQFFLREPVRPVDGALSPSDRPGFGMSLDLDRAESDEVIFPAS